MGPISALLATDGADSPDGTCRVVGTDDETASVILIGAADGHRIHTGTVVTIDRGELDGIAPAEPPECGGSLAASVGSPASIYWSVHALASQPRARPIPGVVGVALFVGGAIGGPVLPLPELVRDAMVLVAG